MKIVSKAISLILVSLIIFMSTSVATINTFANSSINGSSRSAKNVAVLLYSFEDLFMLELKKAFEDIQKDNEDIVKFTFYDGKNNVSVQNETIDSVLKNNVDLFILNLADTRKNAAGDIFFKLKQRNIPAIFLQVPPDVVSEISKNYSKAVFLYSASQQEGALEGKILVDEWKSNKKDIDKNGDNILQYVLLEGKPNDQISIERSRDAISEINNSGIQTEELARINANWLKDEAKESVKNLFLRYGNKIEAIISNNDAMAIGAIEALQQYGYNAGDKSKYIHVVGIDKIPQAKDLIDKGLMTGTVVQDPKIMAKSLYNIGMNLINNENPTENTNYELKDGLIVIPFYYGIYTGN